MGTNAIPCLLKWIRYEKPPWKANLYGFVNGAIDKVNPRWRLTDKDARRADYASWAFTALGGEAKGAVPGLVDILKDPKSTPVSGGRVLLALGSLGVDALPPLLEVLTNQQPAELRFAAAYSVMLMGTNAHSAVPVLLRCLRDKQSGVFLEAGLALFELKVEPTQVVPVLIDRLQENGDVRLYAARLLADYGERAGPSVPALQKLLENTDSRVREDATNALQKIDPQALKKGTAQ